MQDGKSRYLISEHLLHTVYSAFNTRFPSLLYALGNEHSELPTQEKSHSKSFDSTSFRAKRIVLHTRVKSHLILDARPFHFSTCNIESCYMGISWGRGSSNLVLHPSLSVLFNII